MHTKQLIKLAAPIYGGLLATTLTGIADTVFLGRVGLAEQSAAGYGVLLYLVFFVIGFGFTLGPQILIARRMGEGRPDAVGLVFWNSVFCMLGFSAIIFLLIQFFAGAFFGAVTASATIGTMTAEFLKYRSAGIFGTMLNLCFMALYVGKGKSGVITLAAGISAVVNIGLGYVLIFGHLGADALGMRGAAIANAIADLSGTAVFICCTLLQRDNRKLKMRRGMRLNGTQVKEIMNLSVPLVLQNAISVTAWFAFFTIIEKGGERNFGISIILRSVYSLYMMSGMALGSATNSMVSNLIGQKRQDEIFGLLRASVAISLAVIAVLGLSLALFPRTVFMLFTEDAALAAASVPATLVVVTAVVLFSVSNVIFQSVSATGMTRIALLIEVSSILVYLAYTYLVTQSGAPLPVIWLAEVIYMVVFGIISLLYLRSGHWKKARI